MEPDPKLSVIVVFYNMAREASRTLFTLSSPYQRGVSESDYEVIVIDAGSFQPLAPEFVSSHGNNFRLIKATANPSPVAAINSAVRSSQGNAVALCIDGARMLSPGVVRLMLDAFRMYRDPVVATLAWHLGSKPQNESMVEGYNQALEDSLLNSIGWRNDGYELFRISSFAYSSMRGWFRPISESNCLAVRRESWERMGGLHEGFASPGGGLVNLDFYREACDRLGEVVILLGEGTFHQFHGGVATNVPMPEHPWFDFHEEYKKIRGREFAQPQKKAVYLGTIPEQALPFLIASVQALAEDTGIRP